MQELSSPKLSIQSVLILPGDLVQGIMYCESMHALQDLAPFLLVHALKIVDFVISWGLASLVLCTRGCGSQIHEEM